MFVVFLKSVLSGHEGMYAYVFVCVIQGVMRTQQQYQQSNSLALLQGVWNELK